MIDRGKTIEDLKQLAKDDWILHFNDTDVKETAKAALALLKEQKAVPPERESSGGGITWWNVCGACRVAINPNDKYCHECGRPVQWPG